MNKKNEHGNNLVIVVEEALLKKLNMSKGNTSIDMSIKDDSLIIRVHKAPKNNSEDEEVSKIADEILAEYDDVFKKLSKT